MSKFLIFILITNMLKQSVSVLSGDVLLCGYYTKLKTMKKKFFVLYNETSCNAARIEYYDNEKKYKSGFTPKRIIKIKNCFNINRRLYTKHEFVIVLASKDGGFGIVMDSEDEMNTWLNHLLHLQRTSESCFDFPKFDIVWQVIIQKKGVAEQHRLFGSYHMCLTSKSVTFIKIGREKNIGDKQVSKMDVLLTTIRRCGDSQCYFYMEIGRQSSLGPGELWMETEESLAAQNMHRMILSKMISLNEVLIEPMRKRSSSATEATNLHNDIKSAHNVDITNNYLLNAPNLNRERCDSLPSRNRISSGCSNHSIRVIPTTLANRVNSFHISNTIPLKYFASEESFSADDAEECVSMPYLLSSKSPDDAIAEEYLDDSQKLHGNSDKKSLASIMGPGSKVSINLLKHCGVPKMPDTKKNICHNEDDQLHFSVRTYSFGSKGEHDMTKEALVDRVRAFSVGSRMKNTRISLKPNPILFKRDNTDKDFVENAARRSISVPAFINKNFKSVDQMGDLMEIDFSKLKDKPVKTTREQNKHVCQKISNVLPLPNISDSTASNPINIPSVNHGYLEMKPITLASNKITHSANIQQNQYNFEQKHMGIYKASFTETTNDDNLDSSQNFDDKPSILLNYDDNIEERILNSSNNITSSEFSKNYSDKNSSDDIKRDTEPCFMSQDLCYASLDLPNCGNEVNTRYGFKESLSDAHLGEIQNEYAKINFDPPETSCSLREKKY